LPAGHELGPGAIIVRIVLGNGVAAKKKQEGKRTGVSAYRRVGVWG
jgi:hypothetical protein